MDNDVGAVLAGLKNWNTNSDRTVSSCGMRTNVFLWIGAPFVCNFVACISTGSSERTDMQRCGEKQQRNITEEKKNRFEMDLTESIDRLLPLLSKFLVQSEMDPLTIPDARRSFWIVGGLEDSRPAAYENESKHADEVFPVVVGQLCWQYFSQIRFSRYYEETKQPLLFPPAACTEFTYSFSSASLHYLSEVEPDGAVVVSYADQAFNIDMNVGFDSLLFSSDYFLRLSFLQKRGKILVKASWIWARISIDVRVFSCRITLRELKLNDIEFITIFPEEDSWLERWISSIGNVAIFFLKNALIERIEERATALLREYFEPKDHRSCPWNGNLFFPI